MIENSRYNPKDYSDGIAPKARRSSQGRAPSPEDQVKPEGPEDGVLVDSIKGVGRGVAGAIEGVMEIPTVIPGIDYDIEDNFGLGHSTSVPGSLLEGTTQFLVGFLPGGYGLGLLGKAGKARKIANAATVAKRSKVALAMQTGEDISATVARLKSRDVLSRAAAFHAKGSKVGNKALSRAQYGKSMALGGMTDFAVFTHDEARLSNLLQHFGADNPVVNFLAANPDDEAAIGRFKNMLEGAGIGFALEATVKVIRNMFKKQHIIRDGGLTGKEQQRKLEDLELENSRLAEEAQGTPTAREADQAQEGRAPEEVEPTPKGDENADLNQLEGETKTAWRKRLRDEAKKSQGTLGSRNGTSESIRDAIVNARAKEAEQLGRTGDFVESRQRLDGESVADFEARLARGEVDTPDLTIHASDELQIRHREMEVEIDAEFGAGSSNIRSVKKDGKVMWYDAKGNPIVDQIDMKTGKTKVHPLKLKLRALARAERAYRTARTGEIILSTRDPDKGFVSAAHHAELKAMGLAVMRGGAIEPVKVKQVIGEMDEAIKAGGDPLDKIEGVINLALLGEKESRHFMNVMAKLGHVEPAKLRDHKGNLLGLTEETVKYTDKKGKKRTKKVWVDKQGRNFDERAIEELGVQHWADMHGITVPEAQARLKAYGGVLEGVDEARALTPDRANAILSESAETIHTASVRAQSMVHYIDRQLRDATEIWKATRGDAAGQAARDKLGLQSQDAARIQLGRWIDENADMLGSYGRARAETGRALRRYNLPAAKTLTDEHITGIIQEMGGEKWLDEVGGKLFGDLAGGSNHLKIAALKQIDRKRRVWFMINEYFVNAILSGVRTFSTNTMGNAIIGIYGPLEAMMGARTAQGLKSLSGQSMDAINAEVFRSTQEFVGLWSQMADSAKMMSKTWNPDGTGFVKGFGAESRYNLDPAAGGSIDIATGRDAGQGWNAENWAEIRGKAVDPNSVGQKSVEFLGKVIRIPSKGLMATDEFFKQWTYRTAAKADLMLRGHQLKKSGRIENVDEWVDMELSNMTARGQALIRDNLVREAELRFPMDKKKEFVGEDGVTQSKEAYGHIMGPAERQAEMTKWIDEQLVTRDADGNTIVNRGVIADRAVALARERTFTTPLDKDAGLLSDLGVTMTQFGGRHPWFRMVTPFIRTPLNILTYAARRSPILRPQDTVGVAEFLFKNKLHSKGIDSMKTKFAKELIDPDIRVRTDALARFQTAMGFFTGAAFAAQKGSITGAGPHDPDLRKVMKDAGWMPYSIKVGDKYFSYQKLDPMATVLGLYADFMDAHKYSDIDEDDELQRLGMSLIVSTLHNLESKSYLQGLTNIAGLFSDPEINASRVTGQYLSALAIPSFVASFREVADDSYMEMRGPMDQVLSRIPGFSTTLLDPQRNVVGERIDKRKFQGAAKVAGDINAIFNPILVNTTGSDIISGELALLEYGFTNPSRLKYGVDMTDYRSESGQSAYDRWIELVGEVRLGRDRRNVRQRLERLIKSNDYQALSLEGLEQVGESSPRIREIHKILTKYRGYALKEMLKEFPELAESAKAKTITRAALSRGADPTLIRAQLFPMN